jgi:hypothetical protein
MVQCHGWIGTVPECRTEQSKEEDEEGREEAAREESGR